jgi:lactoylglutathione lyase
MKKMLRIITSCYCFFIMLQSIHAQPPHFNHITVYVVDMNRTADFYEKALMLQRIPEPFHDNRHIWMKIGEHSQIHIVQGAKEIMPHDINVHLAFSVSSVENFAKHLDSLNIKYGNWAQTSKEPQVRNDGIKQIYFQDPDGYWIEVNDDKF